MYPTSQAAKRVGIPIRSLRRWIALGKIKPPKLQRVGVLLKRLWSNTDIERLREYKKQRFGEGRGRRTDLQRKRSRKRKK